MRVLLISANTERLNMPSLPLGLACVAAAARHAGHDVSLLDLMLAADPRASFERAVRALMPRFYLAKGLEREHGL